ncbi:hypothetical protein LINPERHAP1_LOCUS5023 [Linum perenne]
MAGQPDGQNSELFTKLHQHGGYGDEW